MLVADPLNLNAVGRVFAAKGREFNRSLPLLISGTYMAEELASELSTRFHILARRFWPGPLTIIIPASAKVPLKVTGNTGRLAVRQSRSRTAQALLDWLDQPLIATSANISGQPTCRSGIDVFGTMDGRVDLDWVALARPGQTIAVYMGVAAIGIICERLIAHGLNSATPAVAVRNASIATQCTVVGTLADLPDRMARAELEPPVIVIIGEVVRLRDRLEWFGH